MTLSLTGTRARIDELRSAPPLWAVDDRRWSEVLDRVSAFADCWEEKARADGWELIELYGLHRRAPGYNRAAMGAAWLIARSRETVLAVADGAILVETETGSHLTLRRRPAIDQESVLAWDLARSGVR